MVSSKLRDSSHAFALALPRESTVCTLGHLEGISHCWFTDCECVAHFIKPAVIESSLDFAGETSKGGIPA